jgi:hypothetical protein
LENSITVANQEIGENRSRKRIAFDNDHFGALTV